MLTIRLSRGGAKKRPFFNLVVTDSRNSRDGRFIEKLGYFNPIATGGEKRLNINQDRLDHWVKTGAKLSERVESLVKEASLGEEAVAAMKLAKKEKVDAKKAAAKAQAEAENAADSDSEAPAE